MSKNGNNEYGVPYTCIKFFEELLGGHNRVKSFSRSDDILFHLVLIDRKQIDVLLVYDYTVSESAVYRYHSDFPSAEYIVTGANWNMYTKAAKACGHNMDIGIFNVGEFSRSLFWKNPKEYYRKDSEGRPIYATRD